MRMKKRYLVSCVLTGMLVVAQITVPIINAEEIDKVVEETSPVVKEEASQNETTQQVPKEEITVPQTTPEASDEISGEASNETSGEEKEEEIDQDKIDLGHDEENDQEKNEQEPPSTEEDSGQNDKPNVEVGSENRPIQNVVVPDQVTPQLPIGVVQDQQAQEIMVEELVDLVSDEQNEYEFWDWDQEEMIMLDNDNLKQVAIAWYDEEVYLYIEELDDPSKALSFTWDTYFMINSNQNIHRSIRCWEQGNIEGTDKKRLTIQGFPGAEGIGHKKGNAYCWELELPVAELGDYIYEVSLNWENRGNEPIKTVTDLSGNHIKEEVPPILGGGSISIDGYFDDWAFIPKTEITYGNSNGTGDHSACLYEEGDMVYGYFKMNELYGNQMPLNYMILYVNDTPVQFDGRKKNPDNTVDWSGNVNRMPMGINTGIGIFGNNGFYLGDAVLSIYQKGDEKVDEYEFCISKERLEEITGIPVESMRNFKLKAPNIGQETISACGTPTGPIGAVGCSVAAVGITFFVRRKRKEQKYE